MVVLDFEKGNAIKERLLLQKMDRETNVREENRERGS